MNLKSTQIIPSIENKCWTFNKKITNKEFADYIER